MYSAIPLKLQISFRSDEAQGLFLAFLGNSVLQDDIFRCSFSHNPSTALCCQYMCHGGKHVAVSSLKMLWQNQGILLFSFTGLTMPSHNLLEPFQEEGHITQELQQPWSIFNQIKASLTPQPPIKCCSNWPSDSMRLCVHTLHMYTQSLDFQRPFSPSTG